MHTEAVFISLLINVILPCSIKLSISGKPGDGDIVICGQYHGVLKLKT